jgi:hypothetical protein
MTATYQLLPPLNEDEYAARRADIAKRGVLVPVEVDENGAILDGHNRSAIAAELGIEVPRLIRSGWTEEQKRDHVLKLNLLRRQLGPIAWAEAFRKFAEGRGVALGQGKRNDRTSATVAEVAGELGVAGRTARQRLSMANQLAQYAPGYTALVDAGMPIMRAVRLGRNEQIKREREEARIRKEAEEAGVPVMVTRWSWGYSVGEWDPDNDTPILTEDERALVPLGHTYGIEQWDLTQRENIATRPMTWEGDTIHLPTGCWYVAVARFVGTTEDVPRRWWRWDDFNGEGIRRRADPGVVDTNQLATLAFIAERKRTPGSAWQKTTTILDLLERDVASLRARLDSGPKDLNDPFVVWELLRADSWFERNAAARRFASWLSERMGAAS